VDTRILSILRSASSEWVSSEVLREGDPVSRVTISKRIRKLQDLGYRIESSTRKGYRLLQEPDQLSEDLLVPWITGTRFSSGTHLFAEVTESTNDDARALAAEGAGEGSFVFAEMQRKGRGRMGRTWHSRAGDTLLGSVLLRPPLRPGEGTLLPLVMASAICTTLHDLGVDGAGIKWPNDVLIQGRKVCGILCEMSVDMDGIESAVLGFGLNVHTPADAFPSELRETACSLVSSTNRSWNRPELAGRMLHELDRLLTLTYAGEHQVVLEEWRRGSVTLGQPVILTFANGRKQHGIAEDVDRTGALQVRNTDGTLSTHHSGEISLRPDVSDKAQ